MFADGALNAEFRGIQARDGFRELYTSDFRDYSVDRGEGSDEKCGSYVCKDDFDRYATYAEWDLVVFFDVVQQFRERYYAVVLGTYQGPQETA